jgi:hypothetical protein
MAAIVDDLADLARFGQTLEETESVAFRRTVEAAWEQSGVEGVSLAVEGSGEIEADPTRLADLFESAFVFAAHNGASTVAVTLHDDGFAITGDGVPLGDADIADAFAYGEAVPDAGAGMTLPNFQMIARTHGWSVDIDREYTEGIRLIVSGATTRPASA